MHFLMIFGSNILNFYENVKLYNLPTLQCLTTKTHQQNYLIISVNDSNQIQDLGFDKNLYSIGSYPDEFESTRIIGERQFRKAVELFNKATEKIQGKIKYRHTYIDFTKLKLSIPQEGGGNNVVETCPAALGFAFAAGTTDGPGAFDFKQGDDKVRKHL